MAADAVRRVYDAIEYQWRTEDATARNGERVAQIAAELLVHPATVNVPTYHLELARTWALANRTAIREKLTRTVVLHARQEWLTMKARIDVIIQQVVRSVEGAREVLRELDAWMDRRLAQLEDAANAARAATPARPRTRRPRQRRN